MTQAARQPRHRRRVLLGAPRADARRVRLRLARPGPRRVRRGRDRGRPRHRRPPRRRRGWATAGRRPCPSPRTGCRLVYGARQQYCPSSPVYRERALALTDRIADRYADHDAVVMWHVGNEYGAHTPTCYCDASAAAFRDWLANRYGYLDELNDAWVTTFWSQRFSDWAEVIPPRRTPYFPNPTQQLDFKRFSSDAHARALHRAERDLIRERTPPPTSRSPRTSCASSRHADYWAWAAAEDVVSDDWYPDLADPALPRRGRRRRRPDAVARPRRPVAADGAGGLGDQLALRQPAQVGGPSTAAGRCSRSPAAPTRVLHFQWRAAVGGAEKWHSAMLPHAGPRTRTWHAVVALGTELAALDALAGARTARRRRDRPRLELLVGARARLASVDPPVPGRHPQAWYEPLWRRGYSIDFVHPESDLTAYPLVLVPQLYSVTDAGARQVATPPATGAAWRSATSRGRSTSATTCAPAATRHRGRTCSDCGSRSTVRCCPASRPPFAGPGTEPTDAIASGWTEHVHLTDAEVVLVLRRRRPRRLPRGHASRPGRRRHRLVHLASLDAESMDALLQRIAPSRAPSPSCLPRRRRASRWPCARRRPAIPVPDQP